MGQLGVSYPWRQNHGPREKDTVKEGGRQQAEWDHLMSSGNRGQGGRHRVSGCVISIPSGLAPGLVKCVRKMNDTVQTIRKPMEKCSTALTLVH